MKQAYTFHSSSIYYVRYQWFDIINVFTSQLSIIQRSSNILLLYVIISNQICDTGTI